MDHSLNRASFPKNPAWLASRMADSIVSATFSCRGRSWKAQLTPKLNSRGRSNVTGKSLVDHLADFRANLEHRGRTSAHTSLVVKRVETILN